MGGCMPDLQPVAILDFDMETDIDRYAEYY